MGLSCSCGDFDKSEHESWWEPGNRSVPPTGERCCECNVPLPPEVCQTILHGEVYDPGAIEPMPRSPWDVDDDEMDDDAFAAIEKAYDAYCKRYGWDADCERFERFTRNYRCERCEGLVAAIEDMGYCMVPPGDLIEQHTEYVNDVSESTTMEREIIWSKDADDVWHPRRKTAADRRRAELRRRWSNAKSWVRWGWRHDLRWKVWWPLVTRTMRGLGYQYTYDRYNSATRTSVYKWKRVPRKLPPWQREANRST